MSKRFQIVNASAMGMAIFLIMAQLVDLPIALLVGAGVGVWWWFSTDLLMKHERAENDRLAFLDAQEAIEWAGKSEPEITWEDLEAEVEAEAAALGRSDELEEMREQVAQETDESLRKLENQLSNNDLALRADRAYTIDQLLRRAGYTATKERSDFWSDSYVRQSGGKRYSIQAIHNLDGTVITVTDWADETTKETSIVSINDPITESKILKALGRYVEPG